MSAALHRCSDIGLGCLDPAIRVFKREGLLLSVVKGFDLVTLTLSLVYVPRWSTIATASRLVGVANK